MGWAVASKNKTNIITWSICKEDVFLKFNKNKQMKTVSAGRQDDDMEEREKKDDTIWHILSFCRIVIGVCGFSAIVLQFFPPLM